MDLIYALVITACLKGECDAFIVDKDFTIEDCTKAAADYRKKAPHVKAECIELDLE